MTAFEQDCAAAGSLPSIDVQYIGRRSVAWLPSSHPSPDTAPVTTTTTSATPEQGPYTRDNFVRYLCHRIDEDDHDEDDEDADSREKVAAVRQRLLDRVALAVARDPTSTLEKWLAPRSAAEASRSVERHFWSVLLLMAAHLEAACDAWRSGQRGRDAALAAVADTGRKDSSSDRAAQACVPTWYGGRCVLSGLVQPYGAHIVPVRASAKGHAVDIWDQLLGFWEPLCRRPFGVQGQEPGPVRNILPLSPDAHGLWDRFQFGLRPVEHPDTLLRPDEPPRRLFVQMVWLDRAGANDDGVDAGDWDHARWGSIADFRRGQSQDKEVLYPPVRHGDVYELVTADPTSRPLPSFHFLQIQHGIHTLMAGVRAAGADPALFGRDPPPDEDDDARPPLPAGLQVPPMWEVALAAAVEAGVLDTAGAARWGKSAIRHQYRLFDVREELRS